MTGDELIAHLQALPAEVRALRVAGYDNNEVDGGLTLVRIEDIQVDEAKYILEYNPVYQSRWIDLDPPEKFLRIF